MIPRLTLRQVLKQNYPVLTVVGILVMAFHLALSTVRENPEVFDFYDVLYLALPLVTAIFSFFVSKKHWSEIFGRAYLFLGIAFAMYFAGEATWIFYETVLHEYPYPSVADVFYFGFYLFSAFHLILNSKYFGLTMMRSTKFLLPVIISAVVGSYLVLHVSQFQEISFDIFYSLIFVSASAFLATLAILCALLFRNSILGSIWLLLAGGIAVHTFSDVWYYFAEVTETFDNLHPANSLWMFSYMIVSYALYKHYKEFD